MIVLKKEKNTVNTEKKENKNSALSVVKKNGVERGGSVCFYPF
jgi:hypothetical protein